MVTSKILYDNVIFKFVEWEENISQLEKFKKYIPSLKLPNTSDFNNLDSIQAHYFAIKNNEPGELIFRLRNEVKHKLGSVMPIVSDFTLYRNNNSLLYRIDTPLQVSVFRLGILDKPSAWELDRTLHTKGPDAIKNLIDKMEEE